MKLRYKNFLITKNPNKFYRQIFFSCTDYIDFKFKISELELGNRMWELSELEEEEELSEAWILKRDDVGIICECWGHEKMRSVVWFSSGQCRKLKKKA